MKQRRYLFLSIFLLLLILLEGCSKKQEPITKSGFYLNTVITITLYNHTDPSLIDGAFLVCDKYEHLLSRTIPGSDIWNINHSDGKPTEVSEETFSLLQTAIAYCNETNGAIDITLAPLSDLWDFTSDKPKKIPHDSDILKLLSNVDYHTIELNRNTVLLHNKNTAIDLGFIAKGFIADKIKEYLVQNGVSSAVINLGGNVVTIGNKPDGSPFTIGIQKPFDSRNTAITTVSTTNSSVVSSGIYERYFKKGDKIYHHILNPRTGYPMDTKLLGVTILSKTSLQGDALSTSCLVLGLKDGMQLIESLPDVEAIFITDDYELHYSSGIEP